MSEISQYDEALHRLNASDWQRQEGSGDPMQEAAVAQVHATLAVVDELRRFNEERDAFQQVMAEFFERLTAKDDEGSLRSEQPAAAPGCQVCGKPGGVTRCVVGPLTAEQWQAHRAWLYQEWRDKGKVKSAAQGRATDTMLEYFGPCPEDS